MQKTAKRLQLYNQSSQTYIFSSVGIISHTCKKQNHNFNYKVL